MVFPVEILSVSSQSIYILLRLAQTFGLRLPIYSMMLNQLAEVPLGTLCQASSETGITRDMHLRVSFSCGAFSQRRTT